MNRLEEIQECIKGYVEQKKDLQKHIVEIEEKRNQLAEKRNELKKAFSKSNEITELGKQISELGNQSQELQNKLDFMFYEIKPEVNYSIDNLITEGIRQIRIISTEKKDLELENLIQEERQAKYEIQKQEFFARFGRVPELSENALEEATIQKEKQEANNKRIYSINSKIDKIEVELSELAKIKTEFKNKNLAAIIGEEIIEPDINFDNMEIFFGEEEVILPLVEEIEPIEEIYIEELEVEPIKSIEELHVEEFDPAKEIKVEIIEEKEPVDEMEKIARAIVEEIAAEQTKDIITFEEKVAEEVKTPVVEEKITLLNIIAKIESGEIVYKAQISNGKEIKLYPTNQILRDKEKRNELKEILIKYAEVNDKVLDLKIVNKIDPTVCEIMIVFANKYNYNPQNLIYDYAMSFSEYVESEAILPAITYNFAYINGTYLSRKEKAIISKICKNANKNSKIDLIGTVGKFSKLKYILKRIFASNKANALPEAKY